MALKGFLSTDNYTVVIIDSYDKKEKQLNFVARTYVDDSKDEILTEANYELAADLSKCFSVLSKDITSVPASPNEGDAYIVGDLDTPPFHGMTGTIATRTGGTWSFMGIIDDICIHVADEDLHYICKSGTLALTTDSDMTPTKWDALFSPVVYDATGANLMQAIFDYLKTTPEFAHTTDV